MSEERILLLQSEHARQYGQYSKLINLIKNIIKDYPHESVFRELLQNADDAGTRLFVSLLTNVQQIKMNL